MPKPEARSPKPAAWHPIHQSVLFGCVLAALGGCSVGEGDGQITSERLFVRDCWEGPFDLGPTFFGANPFHDTMQIRVQRGGEIEDVSDGAIILIDDTMAVRTELETELPLGLPAGVAPAGIPVGVLQNGATVHLALYLNDTCHSQNATLHSIGGSINFTSLFSGDPNEGNSDRRLTEASFEAVVADPRDAVVTSAPGEVPVAVEYPPQSMSEISGSFSFFFHRGAPAQPFP